MAPGLFRRPCRGARSGWLPGRGIKQYGNHEEDLRREEVRIQPQAADLMGSTSELTDALESDA